MVSLFFGLLFLVEVKKKLIEWFKKIYLFMLNYLQTPPNATDQLELDIAQPTNLLVTFFQYW